MFPWEQIRNSKSGTAYCQPFLTHASGVFEGVTLLARIPKSYKQLFIQELDY